MLSGIGPADELRALGIDVVHDLPGVGKNFQDHMDVYITAETAPVSFNEEDRPLKAAVEHVPVPAVQDRPADRLRGGGRRIHPQQRRVRSPDIQIHCLPAYVIDHGRQRVRGHGITINTCNLRPHSIGCVKLNHPTRPIIR